MAEQSNNQGIRLSEIRYLNGDTLEQLADKLGVTKSYLSKIENGHKPLTPELFNQISVVYRLTNDQAAALAHSDATIKVNEGRKVKTMAQQKLQPIEQPQEVQVGLNVATTPIMYSDGINVYANDAGVVINFGQSSGPMPHLQVVSRIGLSHAHAKQLKEVLENTLKTHFERNNMEY